MKIKYTMLGIFLLFLLAVGIIYIVRDTQATIQAYYEELKMQSKPNTEKASKMETYLKSHPKRYLVKELIRDTTSVTVKYWYGITVVYSFLEDGYD